MPPSLCGTLQSARQLPGHGCELTTALQGQWMGAGFPDEEQVQN